MHHREDYIENDKPIFMNNDINKKLLSVMQKIAGSYSLLEAVVMMRHYQKSFFKERKDATKKKNFLDESKKWEKVVDDMTDKLWPVEEQTEAQTKLFEK